MATVAPIELGGLVIHGEAIAHPLLGRAHVIEHDGRPVTAMSETDWDRPTRIPAVAEPRRLPRGAGSLLLNEIARRAQAAGVASLRYAGPYPTHALWSSLLRSFRSTATVELFTRDVLDRAVSLARDEIAIDFTPAPFTRELTPYGYCDRRDGGVDRVGIAGVVYDTEGERGSLARLAGERAILSVGIPIAEIARVGAGGELLAGPQPIPAFRTPANGQELPAALREALAELAGELVAAPLAHDVATALRTRPIAWDDLGWRSARATDRGFAVHVGMLALARDHGDQLARQLGHHLAEAAQAAILEELITSAR